MADDVYKFFLMAKSAFSIFGGESMFLSLGLIFVLGVSGGIIFEKIKIPKLVWYLLLGICLGPSLGNGIDPLLLQISSYLRQIALVIILTRSGLSLDLRTLKKVGRPAILMCFLPACFEIVGVSIFGPLFLKISYTEALLLGSVLAAVSPAVVVPRMIKLKENGYGGSLPEVVMAGASCDDIVVIILFYAFKNLVSNQTLQNSLLQIPLSIILGILLGIGIGLGVGYTFNKIKLPTVIQILLMLGVSFLMIALEELAKSYIKISALLGIIVMALIVQRMNKDRVKEIQKGYNNLWNGFEILLFVLIGCATDIYYAFSKEGAILLGILCISLIFRSLGVLLCVLKTPFHFKEKVFILFSYLPKATVQASIGGIALSEGLSCGPLVLTSAVIAILFTAPLGAFLMDISYKKLLKLSPTQTQELANG